MHGGIFDIDVRLCGGFRAAVEALRAIDKIDGDIGSTRAKREFACISAGAVRRGDIALHQHRLADPARRIGETHAGYGV